MYFSCNNLICGCNACIRFMDFVLYCVKGQKINLISAVSATIAHPYGSASIACIQFIVINIPHAQVPQIPLKPMMRSMLLLNRSPIAASV